MGKEKISKSHSAGAAVSVMNVSKYYKLYQTPKDRLKEALSITGKKYHKEFYAASNINLEIKKGEIVGIVGKNGSGKSTLLKLISGVLSPSSGEVRVNGEISALLELGSGFNPQFTGIENIYFYGSILGFSKQEMDERIDDIVDFAEIGEFIYQPIKVYSSGMKARLAFAVATHIDPDILILDEVLSVGDVLFRRKSYAKMNAFFESGKTIIYVSHNTNEINRLCTRAIFLLDGKIALDGEPKAVTQYYEKYLFARKNQRKNITREINSYSDDRDFPVHESPSMSDVSVLPVVDEPSATDSVSKTGSEPFLVPDFESRNKVEFDNAGLNFSDICIKTLSGDRVNNLITHQKYRFCYRLEFKQAYEDVGFGMQIHTERGTQVTASGSRMHNVLIPRAVKGDVYDIEWEFDCALLAGVYYINVGANHILGAEKVYINRITDAFVFKVIPGDPRKYNGMVSLSQAPVFRKCN